MLRIVIFWTLIWGVILSVSSAFSTTKTPMARSGKKLSKYIYKVEGGISSTLEYYSPSTTTESLEGICNASTLDDYAFRRKKRSIYNFHTTTTTTSSNDIDLSVLSDEFINCTHTTVEPECYVLFPNGSVYVPLYNLLFNKSNYVINEEMLFVCPTFFDGVFEEKFPSAIGIVTIVCVSISTAFIILHIIMFLLVEKLRNLPGYCLFSLCISLLIAYLNFFVHLKMGEQEECKVIGILLMYSFLASFFWMNVISFDVWHSIRIATSKLLLSTNQSILRRFLLYSLYAWGVPLMILIIALIVDSSNDVVEYHLVFRKSTCWFQFKQALLVYFALPLFVVLAINVFFFFSSFHMIRSSRTKSGSQEGYDLRSQLFLTLRLGTAMGLMWIFGVIDTVTHQEWISYLQSICNALQGVFIFFSFNFNARTRNACKEEIRKKKSSILSPTVASLMSKKISN